MTDQTNPDAGDQIISGTADGAIPVPVAVPSGKRQPLPKQILDSLLFMQESSKVEFKRTSDKMTMIALPLSCFVIIGLSYGLKAAPQLRNVVFLAPLLMFAYFVAVRIGIVRTMTPRQAYLVCHMLIATFLMGVTLAIMLLVGVMGM